MEKRPLTPAALRAMIEGDEKNFAIAQLPGGIEAQEALAQQDLIENQKLPKEGTIHSHHTRTGQQTNQTQLETLGFVFGKEIDELFISCQFPQGWSIKPTDHRMWSYVYDDKDRKRLAIFFKGAFYDRRAYANIVCRYHIGTWQNVTPDVPEMDLAHSHEEWLSQPQCYIVQDCDGKVIYHSNPFTNASGEREAYLECEDWLLEYYPLFRNPFAYWD